MKGDMRISQQISKLLSPKKAGELVGLSTITVRRLCEPLSGPRKLGYYKIGRSVRIPESELTRLLEEGRRPA